MKPRLLDLFSGAGGCARGYQEAGFYVVGVDIEPQPNYCGDEFFQGDALWGLRDLIADHVGGGFLKHPMGEFDAIHASPPCQAYTSANRKHPETRAAHAALIAPTRELLRATGLPYVIENVPAATKAVVQEIGKEAARLRHEGTAMAHLYNGLVDLTKLLPQPEDHS